MKLKEAIEKSKNMTQEEFDKIEREKGLGKKKYDINYEDEFFKVELKKQITIFKAYSYDYIELRQMKYFINKENKITTDSNAKPREVYIGQELQFEYTSDQFKGGFEEFVEYMLGNPCDCYECGSYHSFRLVEVETGYMGRILNEKHMRFNRDYLEFRIVEKEN